MDPEISTALRLARRTLDHVSGVLKVGDWEWHRGAERWVLPCRFGVAKAANGIPSTSDWYILATPEYPWGSIKIVPTTNGVQDTYWHQSYNGSESRWGLWRTGDLCLNTTVRVLGRSGFDTEPFSADRRLMWHAERAIQWLEAASNGSLATPGEPFELPQYPVLQPGIFAFCESPETFGTWQSSGVCAGIVELLPLQRGERIFIPRRFCDMKGEVVYEPTWGDMVNDSPIASEVGLWIRLENVPVLPPWRAPVTWGELRTSALKQGVNLDTLMKQIASAARVSTSVLLCVGFPIPAIIGKCPSRQHWLATFLPPLTGSKVAIRGFRPSEYSRWLYDRNNALADNKRLRWIDTENWDMAEVTSRGSLPGPVAGKDVLIIGAGALGAPLARLFVRAGIRSLVIMDSDILQIGNITRHPLDTDHLSLPKADSIAAELRHISPHLRVQSIPSAFPNLSEDQVIRIRQCDLVIDCSAEDSVLPALERFDWNSPKTKIISLSLGMEAKRLFCYASDATSFSETQFRESIAPWLRVEAKEYQAVDLPREGIGCWHPVFPARVDDIWLFVATAMKEVERSVVQDLPEPMLTVFEQTADENGVFTGIQRAVGTPDVP